MRINQFIAKSSPLSRRKADEAVERGDVVVNGRVATAGQDVQPSDIVLLHGRQLSISESSITIILHKPTGFVCSRNGQGSRTIYSLLPLELHKLNPVGRLDKDSSGLLLMTTDGDLAHQLTHPSFEKNKVYEVSLDKPLTKDRQELISKTGIKLEDGVSKLSLKALSKDGLVWQITMHEGRNRQIRRTFASLGYHVVDLKRTTFGPYQLDNLSVGSFEVLHTT